MENYWNRKTIFEFFIGNFAAMLFCFVCTTRNTALKNWIHYEYYYIFINIGYETAYSTWILSVLFGCQINHLVINIFLFCLPSQFLQAEKEAFGVDVKESEKDDKIWVFAIHRITW